MLVEVNDTLRTYGNEQFRTEEVRSYRASVNSSIMINNKQQMNDKEIVTWIYSISLVVVYLGLNNKSNYSRILIGSLLEDRRIDDVIITNIFSLFFKMAESFENLDNILPD